MATQNRAFGTQLNGGRKPLGNLNIPNVHQQKSKSTALIQAARGKQENQENCYFQTKATKSTDLAAQQSKFDFKIFNENQEVDKDVSVAKSIDESLEDNIEAVKRELNSFLIDSNEKTELDISENKENKFDEDSLMVVEDEPTHEASASQDDSLDEISEISFAHHYSDFERLHEYSDSVLEYMLQLERKFMPDPFYMNNQSYVNPRMRSILVDWLVDVADEYKLKDETLFLCVSYVDRFLSKVSITRQEFQLLGTAALFIAAKYEEVYPPLIGEFVYVTDDSYNKYQILKMEKLILSELNFDISTPTVNYFLERYLTDLSLGREVYCLSKYLCLLTLLESTPFLKYYPSEIALSSILVATKSLGVYDQIPHDFLQKSLTFESGLKENGDILQLLNDRNTLMDEMTKLQYFASEHPQQAIQNKFSSTKYFSVSKLLPEVMSTN